MDPKTFAKYRKSSADIEVKVTEMLLVGARTSHVLTYLKNIVEDSVTAAVDIYRLKARLKKDKLGGANDMTAFIAYLQKGGKWVYRAQTTDAGQVKKIFFTHNSLVSLARDYCHAAVIDGTFNVVHIEGVVMLNIVTMTSDRNYVPVAVCFLQGDGKTEEDYDWVITSLLETVYPDEYPASFTCDRELALLNSLEKNLPLSQVSLCIFHIMKDVKAHALGVIHDANRVTEYMNLFYSMVNSKTEDIYLDNLQCIKASSESMYQYLKATWLPYVKNFMKCYVDNTLHYGNYTSSPVEGFHGAIKRHLNHRKTSFLDFIQQFEVYVENVVDKVRLKETTDSNRVSVKLLDCPMYSNLLGRVSNYALNEIEKQRRKAAAAILAHEELPPCTGYLNRCFGLPCSHDCYARLIDGGACTLDEVSSAWHYQSTFSPIYQPPTCIGKKKSDIITGKAKIVGHGRFESKWETVDRICRERRYQKAIKEREDAAVEKRAMAVEKRAIKEAEVGLKRALKEAAAKERKLRKLETISALNTCPCGHLVPPSLKKANWIGCGQCDQWYHLVCVGLPNNAPITKNSPPYFCQRCKV